MATLSNQSSHRLQDILDALESKDTWNCRTVYDCGVDASVWFDQQVHIEDFEDVMDVLPSVRNMSIQQMYESNWMPILQSPSHYGHAETISTRRCINWGEWD